VEEIWKMKCRSPFIVFVGIHSGKSTFYNDDHNGSAGVVYAEPDEVVESHAFSHIVYSSHNALHYFRRLAKYVISSDSSLCIFNEPGHQVNSRRSAGVGRM